MQQEPKNQTLKDAPEPPATPADPGNTSDASAEPEQVIRPEDEALVVERLRELGYIE
jgi:hypothetical protein